MYSGQVLRGAVGRPIPDLLETLHQEYENMGQEISVFKAQRDEYERKRRPPARRLPLRAAPHRLRRFPRLLALSARGARAPAPCPPAWERGGPCSGCWRSDRQVTSCDWVAVEVQLQEMTVMSATLDEIQKQHQAIKTRVRPAFPQSALAPAVFLHFHIRACSLPRALHALAEPRITACPIIPPPFLSRSTRRKSST
jgi:hypothetical protein